MRVRPTSEIIYTSRPMFVRRRWAKMKIYIPLFHVPVKRPFVHRLFPAFDSSEKLEFSSIKLSFSFSPPSVPPAYFSFPCWPRYHRRQISFSFLHVYVGSKEWYVVLRTCREREDVDSASRHPDARKLKCHDDFCCDVPLEPPCRTKRRYSVWCTSHEWSLKAREKCFGLNSPSIDWIVQYSTFFLHKYSEPSL